MIVDSAYTITFAARRGIMESDKVYLICLQVVPQKKKEEQSLTWRYTWLVLRGSGARRRASSRFLNTSVLSLSYPDSFRALQRKEGRVTH